MDKATRFKAYIIAMMIGALTMLAAFYNGDTDVIVAVVAPVFLYMGAVGTAYMGTKIAEKWKAPKS